MAIENPGTYFVKDRANAQERERVYLQDKMLTAMMGGVLPEQADPTIFHEVLDIGCGCGGWLIETAKTYPSMSHLVGVDVSPKMIEYAQAQAEAQGLMDRVHFYVMDALGLLKFSDNSFDLVNQRLGQSYLRTWEWSQFLQKCQRIVRAEGVVRITECAGPQGNSPAFTQIRDLLTITLFQAGYLKAPVVNGLMDLLPTLFQQQRFRQVQMQDHALSYPAGTPAGELFAEDMKYAFRTFLPLFRKWTRVPDNYEELYQQALSEMQQPDFVGTWDFQTIWAHPPVMKVKTPIRYQ